jgi:hypothetical protein
MDRLVVPLCLLPSFELLPMNAGGTGLDGRSSVQGLLAFGVAH